MDSTTTPAAFDFADTIAKFETMVHHIGMAVIIAIVASLALIIFRAVTSTKATTRPVRSYR